MMTDLYQLTMMYGYFKAGKHNEKAVYDLFFRRQGDETNYAVCAGLEQVIELINNLRSEEEDINYLLSLIHISMRCIFRSALPVRNG